MGRFSRVSLIVGMLLFPAFFFAQFNNNTTSPYSRYGLGDLQPSRFGRHLGNGRSFACEQKLVTDKHIESGIVYCCRLIGIPV